MRRIGPRGSKVLIAEPEITPLASGRSTAAVEWRRNKLLAVPFFELPHWSGYRLDPFSTREDAWTPRPGTGGPPPNRRGRLHADPQPRPVPKAAKAAPRPPRRRGQHCP